MKILFILSIFFVLLPPAYGATFSNEDYIIQTNSINIQNNISITPVPSPAAIETLPTPFAFTLSDTLLDFGEVSPTNPITRTATIDISQGGAVGYSLLAVEDHELSSLEESSIIPDTACDSATCTDNLSSVWESLLTFGFGYRIDDERVYRRFANRAKGELAQLMRVGQKVEQLKILHKLNIPATQEEGVYTNTIRFIAVPGF